MLTTWKCGQDARIVSSQDHRNYIPRYYFLPKNGVVNITGKKWSTSPEQVVKMVRNIHLVQNIKNETSKWINTNQLCDSKFQWQEGFGAFSYSKSQINNVIKYIQNQEQHHLKKTFLEEYVSFLEAFEIDWNEQFIFKELI